jgi:hypothetical protein
MAAGGSSDNIKLGPGRIYFAAVGTTTPVSASAALPSANWTPLGYTEAGSEFEVAITTEGIEVEEELDPVLYSPTKRETKFRFQAVETTVSRLALAVGTGAERADDAAVFKFPAPSAIVPVQLVWDSDETPTATNSRIIFPKAYPTGTIRIARRKAPNKATIPMEFLLAYDSDAATTAIVYPNSSGLI